MVKKILVIGLLVVVFGAAAVGAYNSGVFARSSENVQTQAQTGGGLGPAWQAGEAPAVAHTPALDGMGLAAGGNTQAQAQSAQLGANSGEAQVQGGRGWRGGSGGQGSSVPQRGGNQSGVPQATAPEWLTFRGVVQAADATGFELLVDSGETLWVDSGNQYYVQNLGLALQPGDTLTVTGYWMEDQFAAGQIYVETSSTLFQLRDEFGRPMWSGGSQR